MPPLLTVGGKALCFLVVQPSIVRPLTPTLLDVISLYLVDGFQ